MLEKIIYRVLEYDRTLSFPEQIKMESKAYQLSRHETALPVDRTLTLRRRTVSGVSSSVLALPLSLNARSGNPA